MDNFKDSFLDPKSGKIERSKNNLFVERYRGRNSSDTETFVRYKDVNTNLEDTTRKGRVEIKVYGMRPNTRYTVYDGDDDVTAQCQAIEKKYGSLTDIVSDKYGKLTFWYYVGGSLNPETDYAKEKDRRTLRRPRRELKLVPYNGATDGKDVAKVVVDHGGPYNLQYLDADFVQTFFLDPNSVNNARAAMLTSIELFFKAKPDANINISGIVNPSVTIALVDVDNDKPVMTKSYRGSIVNAAYSTVYVSSDASIGTRFGFDEPIQLKTGRTYGIAIIFDDPAFRLWYNKSGDALIGTNTPSQGSQVTHNGTLFQASNLDDQLGEDSNQNVYRELTDTDLKFNINAAKFTANTMTADLVNDNYEFFTIDTISGNFLGGEWVWEYANSLSYETGNIAISSTNNIITGTGTDFEASLTAGGYMVITDGTDGNTEVVQVNSITNSTSLVLTTKPSFTATDADYLVKPVGRVFYYDKVDEKLYLTDSNASNTVYFQSNTTLKGIASGASANLVSVDDYAIDTFLTDFSFNTPTLTVANVQHNFAYMSGASYYVNTSYQAVTDLYLPNHVTVYDALIMSKSNEKTASGALHTDNKSAVLKVNFNHGASNTNLYESPVFRRGEVQLVTEQWQINNDVTNEHTNAGNAKSKHITERIVFSKDRSAEDIRVYLTGFRPNGTDIKVYAKVHNSDDAEAFDDKNWTLLTMDENASVYSALENRNSLVEYSYRFPLYPPSNTTLDGVVTTVLGNTTINGVGTAFQTDLAAGDVIKVYSPLFANNYEINVVESITSNTALDLRNPISNTNVADSGLKIDTLSTPYTAFNNITNDRITRYYDSTGAEHDTYNSMAIKIVLTSSSGYVVPFVDDIRVIGVSA